MTTSAATATFACHDCDLVHELRRLTPGETALCSRCGSVLARGGRDVAARTFAWSLASLVLLVVANSFTFMEFRIAGRVQVAKLLTSVTQLHDDGYSELAAIVLLTSLLAPLLLITGLMLLSGPMLLGRRYGWMFAVGKFVSRIKAWSMMEVFFLGVIVSAIKLSQMAEIAFGPSLIAFATLIVTSTAALAAFEPRALWEHLQREDSR
jgi:paraquat-inducible protein A